MSEEILKLYASKGFLLDKGALEVLSELGFDVSEKIIRNLIDIGIKERVITRKVFDNYNDKIGYLLVDEKDREKNKNSVRLLSTPSFLSKKINVEDFAQHFRSRYEAIKEILEMRDLDNLSSIRRIGAINGVWTIIAMISSRRITKNKNLLLEVEDLTGNSVVLINRENSKLFTQAKNLLLDDVVAFRVSGSSKMLFANGINYPDAILEEERYSDFDENVAFCGDLHVGSKVFLEKKFLKFVDWLNGKVGDERQREIAMKTKYLFLTGDNIDGVGQYPGQEKFLDIKSCKNQYNKVWESLSKIRKNIQIIMCPGVHDAVWIGEPQPTVSEKWVSDLYKMENLYLVPNPCLVEIDGGFKILMYHGASINRFIEEMFDIRVKYGYKSPTRVVKEMLKRRHLAPTHGLMDYVPGGGKDEMVINDVPDIIVTANQHRSEVGCYNNILMIACSCWQGITSFEEKIGNISDPCKVPLFNLKTRKIKIIDFNGENKIKLEDGESLICE